MRKNKGCIPHLKSMREAFCGKYLLNPGFTLFEFIVAFGVLAVLATVAVLVVNPADYMRQSRDTRRIADLDNLVVQVAKEKFNSERTVFAAANTVYISLPDNSSVCGSYTLPALPGGWAYHCVTQENIHKTDGTGWLPVNMQYLKTLEAVPLDPVNNAEHFYEAAFNSNNAFILRAKFESAKKIKDTALTDGGRDGTKYEVGMGAFFDIIP